jgi:AraC-like DNA-binding protein
MLFDNSAMTVIHSTHHCNREAGDMIFVCRQHTGNVVLQQDGREAALEPGAMALLDPLLPYTAMFSDASRMLTVKLPRRPFEARVGRACRMTARRIEPGANGQLVSEFLPIVAGCAGGLSADTAELVETQVLDLLALTLGGVPDQRQVSTTKQWVTERLRRAVEARLSDPALDPATIAGAAGVSVRYANLVLAENGTSIMRLVRAKRLERCRRALEDPSQAARSVSEIAYAWGFSDMTHFSRRFREAYGQTPSEYRRHALTR